MTNEQSDDHMAALVRIELAIKTNTTVHESRLRVLEARVDGHTNDLRGVGGNNGLMTRVRIVEVWKESRRWFERAIILAIIGLVASRVWTVVAG